MVFQQRYSHADHQTELMVHINRSHSSAMRQYTFRAFFILSKEPVLRQSASETDRAEPGTDQHEQTTRGL